MHWDHLTIEDGLSQSFVTCILQDRLGFIWLGTAGGLNRYDGLRFKHWFHQDGDTNSLSHNQIEAMLEDRQGNLWLGTSEGLNCYQPELDRFVRYYHQPGNPNSLSHSRVLALLNDRQGNLWVGTADGLNRFDAAHNRFIRYAFRPHNPNGISAARIRSLYQDRSGLIWIGTVGGGLNCLDPRSGLFRVYRHQTGNPRSLSHDIVSFLHEDRQGRFWVGTDGGGLNRMDRQTGTFRAFRHQLGNPRSLSHDEVYVIYEDRQDRFWVGTDGGGLNRMDRDSGTFTHQMPDPQDPHSLASSVVKTLFQDRQQNLWLGTWQGGLHVQYAARQPFITYKPNPQGLYSYRGEVVRAFFEDQTGAIWVDSDGYGLSRFDSKMDHFSYFPIETAALAPAYASRVEAIQGKIGEVTRQPVMAHWLYGPAGRFRTCQSDTAKLPTDRIDFILTDRHQNQWLMAGHGVLYFEYERRCYRLFVHDPASPHSLWLGGASMFFEDRQGNLWLGVRNGLDRFEPGTSQFRHYQLTGRSRPGYASGIVEDRRGALWVTFIGGGLAQLNTHTNKLQLVSQQGPLAQSAQGLLADSLDRLWISTRNGLVRYDPAHRLLTRYDHSDGLQSDEYTEGAVLKTRNGRFYFGGVRGFDVFDPLKIQDNPYRPPVRLTDFRLANQLVPIRGSLGDTLPTKSPLTRAMPYTQRIELAPDQADFSFSFTALNYFLPHKNRFRYRLMGYDQQWRYTDGAQPVANYTNIDPGSYRFEVEAANNDNLWHTRGVSLILVIDRPWWATVWAYGLYTLGLLGIVYSSLRHYRQRIRLQESARQRAREAEQLRTLDSIKTRFFDNITHEFRTPLTLILTPTEQLRQHLHQPEQLAQNSRRLETIDRNTHQLLGLVNQLLDLSKLEANALPVHEVRDDLALSIEQIVASFGEQAEAKSIHLVYTPADGPADYWFDADKLERIVSNLVANALKFTPEGGTVMVVFTPLSGRIELTVTDTGTGMPADKLAHIFDRFYQVDDSATRHQEGTGIGLALVKELVELQGGQIQVASKPGEGSTFTVQLPYRKATASFEAILPNGEQPDGNRSELKIQPNGPEKRTPDAPVILLVEDNAELAHFIAESLPATYRLIRAMNGAEGWKQSVKQMPDLIISDVLMPIMDGYTLCQKLKEDVRTSHIPVVLLTAKSAQESRLKGLSLGADDYIAKPFLVAELQLRVGNLLEQRRQYREWLKDQLVSPNPPANESAVQTPDPFLVRLNTLLESRLSDQSFGVDQLAEAMAMSRMNLHRKLKAVVNLAPGEVIRMYRLKRATQFLREGFRSAETAYQVGFDSPSYFSQCFRDEYGLSPSAFARSVEKKPDEGP